MTTRTAEPDWSSMVVVGRIARAHGRRGEVIVNPETDFPEQRFGVGSVVYTNPSGSIRALTIASVRFQRGRPVIALDAVESMSQAEDLAGLELRIPESAQHVLPEDVYYEHELIGCRVQTVEGDAIGTVVEVQGVTGSSRLVVRRADVGDQVDIPLAEPICVRVDTVGRLVVIDPPEGLLDVNRPRR